MLYEELERGAAWLGLGLGLGLALGLGLGLGLGSGSGLDPVWRTVSVAAATVASSCLSFAPVEGKAARSSVRRHGQVARSGIGLSGFGQAAHRAPVSGASSRLGLLPLQAWLPLQALANQPGARPAAPRLGSARRASGCC